MFLDTAFLIAFIYGAFSGVKGNMFSSAMNAVKVFIAFVMAMKVTYLSPGIVEAKLPMAASYAPMVNFLIVFVLLLFAMTVLGKIVGSISNKPEYNLINTGLGTLMWLVLLSTGVSALLFFGEQSDLIKPSLLASSFVYPHIDWVFPSLQCHLGYIFPALQEMFAAFQTMLADMISGVKGECI